MFKENLLGIYTIIIMLVMQHVGQSIYQSAMQHVRLNTISVFIKNLYNLLSRLIRRIIRLFVILYTDCMDCMYI